MITEKNHKLLTSQLFVTDCIKEGLASMNSDCQCTLKWDYINYCNKKHSQSVPKTFGRTSPNSILEEFFLFDYANFMQFLLDWGLGLVVFDADCLVSKKKKYNVIFTGNQDFIYC